MDISRRVRNAYCIQSTDMPKIGLAFEFTVIASWRFTKAETSAALELESEMPETTIGGANRRIAHPMKRKIARVLELVDHTGAMRVDILVLPEIALQGFAVDLRSSWSGSIF